MDDYMTQHSLNLQRLYTQVFDSNKDNWISKDELMRAFNRLTTNVLTEGEAAAFMNDVCAPGQNKINFSMMQVAYTRYKNASNPQNARKQLLDATQSLSGSLKASYGPGQQSLGRKK